MSRTAGPISKAYDGKADAEHAIEVAAAGRYVSVPAPSLRKLPETGLLSYWEPSTKGRHTPPDATDLRSRIVQEQVPTASIRHWFYLLPQCR